MDMWKLVVSFVVALTVILGGIKVTIKVMDSNLSEVGMLFALTGVNGALYAMVTCLRLLYRV